MTPKTHKLATLRNAAGLSQAGLGKLLGGVAQATVNGWEARNSIPTKWLPKLADILQCRIEELLDIPAPPEPPEIDRRTLEGQIYEVACKLPQDRKPVALATLRAMLPHD